MAKKFKKITTDSGEIKYDPVIFKKDFDGDDVIDMVYEELPKDSLFAKKVSFEDLMFAFKKLKPTINFSIVNKIYSFKYQNPTPTILDMIHEKDGEDENKGEKTIFQHVFDLFSCNYQ